MADFVDITQENARQATAADLNAAFAEKASKFITPSGGVVASSIEKLFGNALTPQDFGPAGFGVADSTEALQAFFDYLSMNGGHGYIPPGGYAVSETIVITIGTQSFDVSGAGSSSVQFLVNPGFPSAPVLKMAGTDATTQWRVGGFAIQPNIGGPGQATVGFQIGDPDATTNINGYHYSEIHGVQISNLPILWDIVHARMISFVRCSGWTEPGKTNQVCVKIHQNGKFTGDLVFDTCQFVTFMLTGNSAIRILSEVGNYNPSNGECSVCGIKFLNCLIYAGDRAIDMRASNGAYMSDIWFNSIQIDQQTNYAISMISSGSGSLIQDIHVADGYVNRSTFGQIEVNAISLGTVSDLFIHHNFVVNTAGIGVSFYAVGGTCKNVTVDGNTFADPNTPSALIEFNTVKRFSCKGNSASGVFGTATAFHFVQVEAGCDDFIIDGNHAKGYLTGDLIQDYSGNVQKIIANNPGHNPLPLRPTTVGGSPFSYVNTSGAPQVISVYDGSGVGLSMDSVSLGPLPIPANPAGSTVLLPHGRTLTVTYSTTPNIYVQGL